MEMSMEIRFQNASGGWSCDCALVFVFEGTAPGDSAPALWESSPWLEITPGLRDFKGKKEEQAMLYGHPELPVPRVLVMGLGKEEEFSLNTLRLAVARATAFCRSRCLETLGIPAETALAPAKAAGVSQEAALKEMTLSALLGLYRCEEFRSEKKDGDTPDPRWLALMFPDKETPDPARLAVREGEAEAAGMLLARALVNGPGNLITPVVLAEEAQRLAARHGYTCTVFGGEDIREMGMGAFWAVARGAKEAPRLIILEHSPRGREEEPPLILVGKGITFDSGGISLKPAANMHEMKGDMGGAAAVLGFFSALGEMPDKEELPRVIGIIAATENMPGGNATRPGDVITTLSGKTVEILNTDAEGRMVVCDALTLAQKEWTPKAVVDIATLTGACVVALGDLGAGLFTEDEELRDLILESADMNGELYWPMPLWKDYEPLIKSDVADMSNTGPREGGAINAALFLRRFVEKGTRWAHLDIAGPGYVVKPTPLSPVPGGTGTGVRIFCHLLRHLQ